MSQSDRRLEGAGHLKIPDSLVMVSELDFKYSRICKTLRSGEESLSRACEHVVVGRSPSDLYLGVPLGFYPPSCR